MSNIESIGVVWPKAEATQEEVAPKPGCRGRQGALQEFIPPWQPGLRCRSPPVTPPAEPFLTCPSPQTHSPALSSLVFTNDFAFFLDKMEARKKKSPLDLQLTVPGLIPTFFLLVRGEAGPSHPAAGPWSLATNLVPSPSPPPTLPRLSRPPGQEAQTFPV